MNRNFKKQLLSLFLATAILLSFPVCALADTPLVSPSPFSAGYLHSAVIKEDGSLWTAGANTYGQLGNGTDGLGESESSDIGDSADSTEFVKVLDNVKAVYAGYLSTFAIDGSDALWVWGWNEGGQLGFNDLENKNKPVVLLEKVSMAAPGDYHSAVVTLNGELYTFGWNQQGQLGTGGTENAYTPQQVLTDVRTAAVGLQHTLAVKNDNTLWACGDNTYGQLCDGTKNSSSEFIQVMDHVQSVAATAFGTLILKTDGALWACGYNADAVLGNGSYEDIATPVEILSGVQQVSASREFAAAVGKDHTLYAWGKNAYGQYGGETSSSPLQIAENVDLVSTGGGHLLYLQEGTVYAMGNNERGQFGLGTTDDSAVPLSLLDDVALVPNTSAFFVHGPIVVAIIVGVLVLALFAFLIVRTLHGKPIKPQKKNGAGKGHAPKDPEKELSRLSDEELLRMAEQMNASNEHRE